MIIREPIGIAGCLDIAGDGFFFFSLAVGLYGKALHQQRPCLANDQRGQQHQHHCQAGNAQVLDDNGHKQGHGHKNANDHQDDLRRQVGVDIGIGTTGKEVVLGIKQLIALQPVADDLGYHPQAGGYRQLQAGWAGNGSAHTGGLIANPDASQHVVAEKRDEEGQNQQDG